MPRGIPRDKSAAIAVIDAVVATEAPAAPTTPTTCSTGGIHRKMLRLMEEVGGIAKDRTGQGINYKFRGIDDLYAALHPALRKVGVAMYPVMMPGTKVREQTSGTRASGKPFVQTSCSFDLQVQFVDADDGSTVFVIAPAEGVDDSDKCTGKAMSYGMKSALFHALAIPTEDPDDERPVVEAPKKAVTRQPKEGSVAAAVQEKAAPTEASAPTATEMIAAQKASPDAELIAVIKATKTQAELNAFIDATLRGLPPDRQLPMARVCKEHRATLPEVTK